MTVPPSGRPSYRWLIITLLVASGVYAWYTVDQFGRLNELNQRQLSNAGAELKAALQSAQTTVAEFNRKWLDWQNSSRKLPDAHRLEPQVCDFDKGQPYLDVDACAAAEPVRWNADRAVRPTTSPALGIEARISQSPGSADPPIQFRFRTDTLLQELAFGDAFELIVVATGEGVVLYEEAPAQRRWLRHLRWGEQTFRDTQADRPPTLQIQNLQEVLGAKDAWTRLRSVSSRTSLQLGDTAFQIYLQPMVLDVGGKREELIIGGAIPTASIVRDALAVDTGLLGVMVFVLLLGVLGFPFVKLAFLDPHERFRLRDVNLLYLSTGALLVLFTCATLAWDGYLQWREAANEGLKALAGDLETGFLKEVTSVRDQLLEYDAKVKAAHIDCELEPVQTQWFSDRTTIQEGSTFSLPRPDRKIQLRLVAWIRPDGKQIWKATSDSIQGRTPVDKRVYFRAVRDGNLFQLPDGGPAMFIGTDRSIINGRFYTFVSMRSAIPDTFCGNEKKFERTPVMSATVQLLSLDRQPLPAGYGFALINREGRTLYHSDRRLSLREHFFEELNEGIRARAMMYAGRSGRLASGYRERPHELYLKRIALNRAGEQTFAGFYLVAFRDTSVERTVVGHVLVKGLFGPLLLLFGIFAAGLWGVAVAGRVVSARWSAWLWPHGGLQAIYRRQASALVVLLFCCGFVSWITRSAGTFVVSPVLAAALGVGIYTGGRRDGPRRRLTAPGWHAGMIVLVLLFLVIAPSAGLFRLALRHELAKIISTERAWIGVQQVDVIQSAEIEALEDNYGPAQRERRAAARREYFSCVPAPYDAESESPRPPVLKAVMAEVHASGSSPDPAAAVAAIAAPVLRRCDQVDDRSAADPIGVVASERRALLRDNRIDAMLIDVLQWPQGELPISNEIVWRQRYQDHRLTYVDGSSWLASWPASGGALAGFGLVLALLVWWIRWNTNRLFFADVEPDAAAAAPAEPFELMWKTRSTDEQMVLIQIARERIANPYQRSVVRHLLDDGTLRLAPDLQPGSPAFAEFLRTKHGELQAELRDWESVNVGHSWSYVRLILIAGVTGVGLFLIATQPALQSSLLGIATGITGLLTTGLKLRDAVTSWLAGRGSAAQK